MKNKIKYVAFALFLLNAIGCEKDDEQIIASPKGAPELLTPQNGSAYVLKAEDEKKELTTLVWNHADYSIQTQVNYEIEVAKSGTNFAKKIAAGTSSNRFVKWTVGDLNNAITLLEIPPFVASDVDVRIKSWLGSNKDMVAYSNIIKLNVTSFSKDLLKLAVPGQHQGWKPEAADVPLLASSSPQTKDHEGYVNLNGGFKLIAPKDGKFSWSNGDSFIFGDDGTNSNILKNPGSDLTGNGYCRIKANTNLTGTGALSYSVLPVVWGVIGAATPTGWDSDTNMTYNDANKTWEITLSLKAGEFKFRANDDWGINLGGFDAGKIGEKFAGNDMSYDGINLAVSEAGMYKIVLNLSNPRAYKYTLTKI